MKNFFSFFVAIILCAGIAVSVQAQSFSFNTLQIGNPPVSLQAPTSTGAILTSGTGQVINGALTLGVNGSNNVVGMLNILDGLATGGTSVSLTNSGSGTLKLSGANIDIEDPSTGAVTINTSPTGAGAVTIGNIGNGLGSYIDIEAGNTSNGVTINTSGMANTAIGNTTGTTGITGKSWSVADGATSTITATNFAGTASNATSINGNTVPSNGTGYLHNNGSGTLTWGSVSGGLTPTYLYAYNTGFESVAAFSKFSFPSIGDTSGITCGTSPTTDFTITTTGIYLIQFSVYPGSSNATAPDVAVWDNLTALSGGEFQSLGASTPVNGTIIASLTTGDDIYVKNVGSGSIALTSGSGSANTVSITITRIK